MGLALVGREALSRTGPAGPGPAVIQVAGAATIAAGLLRRDRMEVTRRAPSAASRPVWMGSRGAHLSRQVHSA